MAKFSQQMLAGLLNPSYQKELMNVGRSIGAAPRSMMMRQQKEQRQAEIQELLKQHANNPAKLQQLANQYRAQGNEEAATAFTNAATQAVTSGLIQPTGITPEQLLNAAQQMNSLGRTQEALDLAQQARDLQATTQQGVALQARRESIASSARKLGLDELAERALSTTDEESLRAIQKDLRAFEIKDVIKTRGIPGRKALAKNAGIEYEEYMSDLSDDGFAKVLEGSEATLKSFIDPNGNEIMLEVNKQGRVKEPTTEKFVRASDLGLRPAPNRQQVENIANFTNEKLAEAGVKRYDDLANAAGDATKMMNNITEVLPNVDEMITGRLANAELFVRGAKQAIASAAGLDPSDPKLENTQVFSALAAPRVATIIKDFGAGTGLSDADREFAQLASAGDITMTATALRNILKILKDDADRTLSLFDDITADIRKDQGQDPLIFYRIPALKARPTLEQPTVTTTDDTGIPALPPGATLD